MLELFRKRGYQVVDFGAEADVYLINTCTVTSRSEAKSRQTLRRTIRENPEAVVAVAGCYAQVAAADIWQIPGVDVLIGTQGRHLIVDLVEQAATEKGAPVARAGACAEESEPVALRGAGIAKAEMRPGGTDLGQTTAFEELPIFRFTGRTRAAVKVQEGCNQFCSYCLVPFARGRSRSRHPGAVKDEVLRLAEAGFKEVVLTGIHLGAYGNDLDGTTDLAGLVEGILDIPGLQRIRLSSIEPLEVSPKLIQLMAREEKLCRHLHIPLQSGSDQVLARMNRRYGTGQYSGILEQVRRAIPEVGISTDVMVGFPGETEEEFRASSNFVREMSFSRVHVFPYSRRPGTRAASFPGQLPRAVKEERSRELLGLAEQLALDFHRRYLDRVVSVLVEEGRDRTGWLEGLTDNYLRVIFPGGNEQANQVRDVLVTAADREGARGCLQDSPP